MSPMTQAKWNAMSEAEKAKVRSTAGLTKQLIGLEGCRVEVVTTYGEKRRFWVGRSTGWVPCHIELSRTDSSGGPSAEKDYELVRVVRHKKR